MSGVPLTPPDLFDDVDTKADEQSLQMALHVLSVETQALANLGEIYGSDMIAREGFIRAINVICKNKSRGGSLVVCGVGKSGKIGQKAVATLNSFGIRSMFLHPAEALHGDLGMIGQHDTMLIISYSGRTPELLAVLPHIPSTLPIIAITAQTVSSSCQVLLNRPPHLAILLPAPVHISEAESFGVPSPTTSTTTALALTDALALAIVNRLHPNPSAIFHGFHPGGTIGALSTLKTGSQTVSDLAIEVQQIPLIQSPADGEALSVLDAFLAATQSASGWVRASTTTVISPRQIRRVGKQLQDIRRPLQSLEKGVVIEKQDWISIPAQSSVLEARQWILSMRKRERGRSFLRVGTVMGVVDSNKAISSVVEIDDIVGEAETERWEKLYESV